MHNENLYLRFGLGPNAVKSAVQIFLQEFNKILFDNGLWTHILHPSERKFFIRQNNQATMSAIGVADLCLRVGVSGVSDCIWTPIWHREQSWKLVNGAAGDFILLISNALW